MSEPQKNPGEVIFSSDDCVVVVFDGPGDHTRRPRRPNNPRNWPPPPPTKEAEPPADQTPPEGDGNGK